MRDTQPRRFIKLLTVNSMPEARNSTTGEVRPTPTFLCQRWGSVEPMVGRELMIAKEVQADVTHKIEMYSDSTTRTITPQMQVMYGARTFNILYVMNLEERNRRTMMYAKEQV